LKNLAKQTVCLFAAGNPAINLANWFGSEALINDKYALNDKEKEKLKKFKL